MDADRFDALSRSLAARGSRRRALASVLSGALGVLGLAEADEATAANSGKCRRKPGECERCDRGKCTRKNGEKSCKRGKIKPKAAGTPCSLGTCQSGACSAAPAALPITTTPPTTPAPPACRGLQVACSSSAQCCTSTTGAVCEDNFCPSAGNIVCCKPIGGSCGNACDCCGPTTICFAGFCRLAAD
jgi:hypothetical protein